MWIGENSVSWATYIDPTTWNMKSEYEAAKYKCMRLNRDMNGNGQIDKEEIQWYLASINQLTDLWIGENSFDPQSRLYKLSTWEIDKQWYASSTILNKDRQWESGIIDPIYSYRDDPEVLWSSEGSSVGALSGTTRGINHSKVYYRCVRNLGLAKNAPEAKTPDDFVSYEPWKAFEIHKNTFGNTLTWETVRGRSQPGGKNPICPNGWRVPNQRELALMYSRMPRNSTSWPLKNHFSRSSFSFNPSNGERVGFSVDNNGEVYYLINNKNTDKGGVRCVKDIN